MGVVERIMDHSGRLTATERRIAELLAGEPQAFAFGTVAQVAERAATSGPSVVRLAVKLGYQGFVELQAAVQAELARQLGPAHDRIRQRPPSDILGRLASVEQDNVARTLRAVSPAALERCVALLADRRRHVWVLPGDVTRPVGVTLASHLGQLREGVSLTGGSEVTLGRVFGGADTNGVVVAIDIRRYERALVAAAELAGRRGLEVVALTDSPLSPLTGPGVLAMFVSASGVGPFDSMTGAMALVNLLVAATAARLRQSATKRLDGVEEAWGSLRALVAEPGGSEPLTPALLDIPHIGDGVTEPAGGHTLDGHTPDGQAQGRRAPDGDAPAGEDAPDRAGADTPA